MNILLLTDMPPSNNFTAGIVLSQLVQFLLEENHKICCYAVVDKTLQPDIPQEILSQMPYAVSEKPIEYWGAMKHGFFLSLVMNNYIAAFELPKIADQVIEFAKDNDVDLIWSVVQGQTMIKIVRRIALQVGKPYTVQVWDPPQWWLKEYKFDPFTAHSVMKEFKKMILQSQTCLTASWAMAEEYYNHYNAKCIPVIPGLAKVDLIENIKKDDSKFLIGFSGQAYAKKEFKAFFKALDYMNWKHENKQIEVKLYGRQFDVEDSIHIKKCGYMEQNQLLVELQNMDLLYCPYFFDKKYELISRLSFPSKLTSYLSIKKPVFFHGPILSSPGRFINDYNAGFICNTLEYRKIAEQLSEIISVDKALKEKADNGYEAFKAFLTNEKMKESFFKSLGIEKEVDHESTAN